MRTTADGECPSAPAWTQIDDVFTPYLPPQMRDARTSGRRGPFASDEAMEARPAARTTLGRLGSPADVVEAVAYLIEADYVTGEQLVVDGGHSL